MKRKEKSSCGLPVKVANEIERNIDQARDRVLNYKLSWPAERDLNWFMLNAFSEEALHACGEGFKYCSDDNRYGQQTYFIYNYNPPVCVRLTMYSRTLKWLLPRAEFFILDDPDLNTFLSSAADIVYDFAKVAHVFGWFCSQHASPALLRTYCPWVRSLTSYEFPTTCSLSPPPQFGKIVHHAREAATIMGSALLTPDAPKRTGGWSVTFTSGERNGIPLPEVTVNM